jgi:hypothetical protein
LDKRVEKRGSPLPRFSFGEIGLFRQPLESTLEQSV